MVNDYRKFWHDKPDAPVLYANGDSFTWEQINLANKLKLAANK